MARWFVVLCAVCTLGAAAGPSTLRVLPWSGILAPSRATDWTTAGATITTYTQCGPTISAYTGTAATINNALAGTGTGFTSCTPPYAVVLGSGDFSLSSSIRVARSNVVLRGAGAGSTRLIFSNSSESCGTFYAPAVAVCTDAGKMTEHSGLTDAGQGYPGPDNATTWTATAYTQGQSVITLASGYTNLRVGDAIVLDQANDASDGYPATGDLFLCNGSACTTCCWEGGGGVPRAGRMQIEFHSVLACGTKTVTGQTCDGGTITISPGLMAPNWRAAQSPGAWWGNSGVEIKNVGVEDLLIDFTAVNSAPYGELGIIMTNSTNAWVRGVSLVNTGSIGSFLIHVAILQGFHITVEHNYFYGPIAVGGDEPVTNYQLMPILTSLSLYQNNIFHRGVSSYAPDDAQTADVFAYNYTNDIWWGPGIQPHQPGEMFSLFEGNNTGTIFSDNIHGTHFFGTAFRNHIDKFANATGVTSSTCPSGCDGFTLNGRNRFYNLVANVLGATGTYPYSTYELTTSTGNAVYGLGYAGSHGPVGGCSQSNDTHVKRTLLRWWNWDSVTSTADTTIGDSTGTRKCTGNGVPTASCTASEVPSAITNYANPVPTASTLPVSFYLPARPRPAWFVTAYGTPAWPPIGPDVTITLNPSGMNTATAPTGGHADKIPARLCFEGVGNHGSYGSSNPRVKLFNRLTCYPGS